ncbi:hypothetical protein GCM10027093_18930 [Paraburkholderia jirisanensis]
MQSMEHAAAHAVAQTARTAAVQPRKEGRLQGEQSMQYPRAGVSPARAQFMRAGPPCTAFIDKRSPESSYA